jgi:hypothetical protein
MPVSTRAETTRDPAHDYRMAADSGQTLNEPSNINQHAQQYDHHQLHNESTQPLLSSPGAVPVRATCDTANACTSPAAAIISTIGGLIGLGERAQVAAQPLAPPQQQPHTPVPATMMLSHVELHDNLSHTDAADAAQQVRTVEAENVALRAQLDTMRSALDELQRPPTAEQRTDVDNVAVRLGEAIGAHNTEMQKPKSVAIKIESPSDDNDDNNNSDDLSTTSSSATGGRVLKLTKLSSIEVTNNMTTLEPGAIADWCRLTRPLFGTKEWDTALDMSEAEFFKACGKDPIIQAQDAHNAPTLMPMLDTKAQRVRISVL